MDLHETLIKLRFRTAEYLVSKNRTEISVHVNSIFIAAALTEYAIKEKRLIRTEDEGWFRAGYHLQMLFEGSKWVELSDLYIQFTNEVKRLNYLR